MSKQPSRRPAPKRRPQARKGRTVVAAQTAGKRSDRTSWIIAGVVIAIGGALVFVFASEPTRRTPDRLHQRRASPRPRRSSRRSPASRRAFTQVGAGHRHRPADEAARARALTTATASRASSTSAPSTARTARPSAGPWCTRFSRFGTFTNLKITRSADRRTDVTDPEHADVLVPRVDVHEPLHPVRAGRAARGQLGYKHARDADQGAAGARSTKYDAPPYVRAATSRGAIPFIDFANEYLISGATYYAPRAPGQDARPRSRAAHARPDVRHQQGRGRRGQRDHARRSARSPTTSRAVCSDPAIKAIEAKLK